MTGCKLTATPKSKRFTTKDTKVAQNARKESLRDFLRLPSWLLLFFVVAVFMLTTPEPTFVPVDAPCPSVLICDYTGKEVV